MRRHIRVYNLLPQTSKTVAHLSLSHTERASEATIPVHKWRTALPLVLMRKFRSRRATGTSTEIVSCWDDHGGRFALVVLNPSKGPWAKAPKPTESSTPLLTGLCSEPGRASVRNISLFLGDGSHWR